MLAQGVGKTTVQAKTGVVVGVYGISLDILPGEIFVIMGLSGSSKSTPLRLINRLHEPTQCKILVDSEDVTAMNAGALRGLRRSKFGMVFQSFALLPHRTVLGNVEFGLEIQDAAKAQRRERAMQIIEICGACWLRRQVCRRAVRWHAAARGLSTHAGGQPGNPVDGRGVQRA